MAKPTRPFFWVNRGGVLHPHDANTEEFLREVREEAILRTQRPTLPRSLPQHNYYWAGLAVVVEATECAPTVNHLHDFLVKRCGYVSEIIDNNGRVVDVVRDSTAFDEMDEYAFAKYAAASDRCMAEVLGIDAGEMRRVAWAEPKILEHVA